MMNIFTFQEKGWGWGGNQQRLSASGCAEFISREDSKACFSLNKLKKLVILNQEECLGENNAFYGFTVNHKGNDLIVTRRVFT